MQPFSATAALILFLSGVAPAGAQAAELIGTWLTPKQDARIRIARCGAALCGTIVWTKIAIDPATGKPPLDANNPDPQKRSHPIVGLRIFAMTQNRDGQWTGDIYNAHNGHSYDGKLKPRGGGKLEVDGCFGLICGSETWRQVGP